MKRTAIASMLVISLMGTSAVAGSTKAPVISSQSVAEDASQPTANDMVILVAAIAIAMAIVSR